MGAESFLALSSGRWLARVLDEISHGIMCCFLAMGLVFFLNRAVLIAACERCRWGARCEGCGEGRRGGCLRGQA
jgi:hypothetical protein